MKIERLRLDPERAPWDRQPGEGEKFYAYLGLYRDMGRARTLAQVAETLALSPSYVRGVAAAHHWTHRVEAWDREQDRLYGERMALLRRDMAEQDARLANSFLAKAVQRLQRLDVDELAPADLVRWCEFATKLRRAAYGAPEQPSATTSITPVVADGEVVDYGALTPQQRVARMRELRDELDSRIAAAKAMGVMTSS